MFDFAERGLFSVLSPSGSNARLSILIFHRVVAEPDPMTPGEIDAKRFDALLDWLGRTFNVLPLSDAVSKLKNGRLPARSMSITFDDGYADNHDIAMPLLQKHGMTATFFIAVGFIDGGRMWNDTVIESMRRCERTRLDLSSLDLGDHPLGSFEQRRKAAGDVIGMLKYRPIVERLSLVDSVAALSGAALPDDLMMSSSQLRGMRKGGMEIGAHTIDHPILARLSDDEAERQIVSGKAQLEALLDEDVALFAYPNGKLDSDFSQRDACLVKKAGFTAAVTTEHGVSTSACDLMQLPRYTPWAQERLRRSLQLAKNLQRVR